MPQVSSIKVVTCPDMSSIFISTATGQAAVSLSFHRTRNFPTPHIPARCFVTKRCIGSADIALLVTVQSMRCLDASGNYLSLSSTLWRDAHGYGHKFGVGDLLLLFSHRSIVTMALRQRQILMVLLVHCLVPFLRVDPFLHLIVLTGSVHLTSYVHLGVLVRACIAIGLMNSSFFLIDRSRSWSGCFNVINWSVSSAWYNVDILLHAIVIMAFGITANKNTQR
jgi:hypothetical protein